VDHHGNNDLTKADCTSTRNKWSPVSLSHRSFCPLGLNAMRSTQRTATSWFVLFEPLFVLHLFPHGALAARQLASRSPGSLFDLLLPPIAIVVSCHFLRHKPNSRNPLRCQANTQSIPECRSFFLKAVRYRRATKHTKKQRPDVRDVIARSTPFSAEGGHREYCSYWPQ
jgi:hypothetical protein